MFDSNGTVRESAPPLRAATDPEPRAPELPKSPLKFVLHCVIGLRRMYLGVVLLEAINAGCTMLLPQALGRIVKGISKTGMRAPSFSELQQPLIWFMLLATGE